MATTTSNRIRCTCCGQEAVSHYRHDFVKLENCRNGSFVDGGSSGYMRLGGKDMTLIEVWLEKEQKWTDSKNQVAIDLFQNGKYDFPAYSNERGFDFQGYLKKRDEAEKSLKEALFARFGLQGRTPGSQDYDNQAESLWYSVWNMPFRTTRDPDPRDVYFYFIHFVTVIKPRVVREGYLPVAEG